MNLIIALILLSMSFSSNAEVFIPQDSKFELIPRNNGMYIQFSGEIEVEAEIAVRSWGNNYYDVVVMVDDEIRDYFPYRSRGVIQKPEFISLKNSDALAKKLIAGMPDGTVFDGTVIIGTAKVSLLDFNSSADCSVVTYFVKEYRMLNYKNSGSTKKFTEREC